MYKYIWFSGRVRQDSDATVWLLAKSFRVERGRTDTVSLCTDQPLFLLNVSLAACSAVHNVQSRTERNFFFTLDLEIENLDPPDAPADTAAILSIYSIR